MSEKVKLIIEIIKQHCPDEYQLNWQLLFTFKALICVVFKRRNVSTCCDTVIAAYLDGGTTYVPGEPTTQWFKAVVVPVSWNEWYYAIEFDSD